MRSPTLLGKTRIEALSDGVFSISMTLLVLKLEVPEVMHHSTNEAMLRQILALAPAFTTYVVTFLIAGGFWLLHHRTFHFIRHVSSFLLWVNLLFLMFVALLPFSAGLMSHLFVHPVSQLFYFGNQLAIALLLNVHWHSAVRMGFTSGDEEQERARIGIRIAAITIAFAACWITALLLPAWSLLPLPVVLACSYLYLKISQRDYTKWNHA